MSQRKSTLRIRPKTELQNEVDAFLIDRQARGLAAGTLRFYRQKLFPFVRNLVDQGLDDVELITAPIVRRYLLDYSETHAPGGTHAAYRCIKAFLRWYEMEVEPDDWKNPMPKVRAPRVPQEPLEPVDLDDFRAMIATCGKKRPTDLRDRALLLALLDTGCRASEMTSLTIGDLNLAPGTIVVRKGKGSKVRSVFLGSKARRAVVRYLRVRDVHDGEPLFASTATGGHLSHSALRDIVRRRADRAGVPAPSLHSFRRAFALLSLRNGVDVYSLQRMMGHADLSVLRRYLAQTNDDLRLAHERTGPVDRLV